MNNSPKMLPTQSIFRHEVLSLLLATLISTAILIQKGYISTWHFPLLGGIVAMFTVIKIDHRWHSQMSTKLRLFVPYIFMLWIYIAVAKLVPLLNLQAKDHVLLAIDRFFLGETPALSFTCKCNPLSTSSVFVSR